MRRSRGPGVKSWAGAGCAATVTSDATWPCESLRRTTAVVGSDSCVSTHALCNADSRIPHRHIHTRSAKASFPAAAAAAPTDTRTSPWAATVTPLGSQTTRPTDLLKLHGADGMRGGVDDLQLPLVQAGSLGSNVADVHLALCQSAPRATTKELPLAPPHPTPTTKACDVARLCREGHTP